MAPTPDVRFQVATGPRPEPQEAPPRVYADPAMTELMRIRDKAMAAKAKRDALKAPDQAAE